MHSYGQLNYFWSIETFFLVLSSFLSKAFLLVKLAIAIQNLDLRPFLFKIVSVPFQIQMPSSQNHVHLVVRHYTHTCRLVFECLHRLNDCVGQFYLDTSHPVNNKKLSSTPIKLYHLAGFKVFYQWNNSCFVLIFSERIGAVM